MVELYFVGTEYQLADRFTKALPKERFEFSIDASSSVPWIYLGQFWHTLKEDGSKYRLMFVLDRKEIRMTHNDFRRIFQLLQAIDNNHERFVVAPKFSELVPFFLNDLGFTLELRSPSNFKKTGLVQPWQTLGKMFARCLTTRVTGLHYALQHPSTLIPYPRFTKLIVGHYITAYPKISKRVRDKYHNLEHNQMIKSIFNSGKNKVGVRIKIPRWMITDEMKLTENYRMYADAFGVDVLTTRSQPIESTYGTYRTTSAPRTPNLDVNEGESSQDDLKAKQNEEKVKEHLIAEEIEKMVEGTENVENDEVVNYVLNNQEVLGTRLDPGSYKESLKVEIIADAPVNVIK
ncbi:hypothetical protein Tco_0970761 [Tanacetum coccineum]